MTNTLIRPVTTSCYLALFTSKTILVFQSLVTAVKFFFSLAKVIKIAPLGGFHRCFNNNYHI